MREVLSLCHWGAFLAGVEGSRIVSARPWPGSGADPEMIGAWPRLVHGPARIDRPHVRESFLRDGPRSAGDRRGRERMIPVDWETALDLAARETARVRDMHGPAAIFGGSYGWSSAGRFHHARSQLRRFLAASGGYTDQIGNYSWGAAQTILPYVLGDFSAVAHAASSWTGIAEHCDALVAFGGLNPKNWRVTSGGAGRHDIPQKLARAVARGMRVISISPFRGDIPDGVSATWIAPRPNSDTAILLGLCHRAVESGRADRDFLARSTHGHEAFLDYLFGKTDGQPKTLPWAADRAGLDPAELEALWSSIAQGRVMLTAAWALQRADHGEQPFWALIALAAMLGQIGLPGGGFTFGYGSMNAVGADARRGYVPALPSLPNPADSAIPVARFADMLLEPGREIRFDGRVIQYPDIRLVHWAGGNPFHHGQDLNRQERAWAKPETIIVHEAWWTPTARRADIVLPATTTLEREDIGGSSRDPYVFHMPRAIPPVGLARNDVDILRDLADRLGVRHRFDEGLDDEAWLRRLWADVERRAEADRVSVPDFDRLRAAGAVRIPAPDMPEVLLSEFRTDPLTHPLRTQSGRIELFSTRIAAMALDDCPPHPAWLEPFEWLGNAARDELHLLTHQPARQLHSQLWQARDDDGPELVRMHPDDAKERDIADGALVRIWNARGACRAKAKLDTGVRRGVLIMATGAWFEPGPDRVERNGNANVLTRDQGASALTQACAALSCLARIEVLTED